MKDVSRKYMITSRIVDQGKDGRNTLVKIGTSNNMNPVSKPARKPEKYKNRVRSVLDLKNIQTC